MCDVCVRTCVEWVVWCVCVCVGGGGCGVHGMCVMCVCAPVWSVLCVCCVCVEWNVCDVWVWVWVEWVVRGEWGVCVCVGGVCVCVWGVCVCVWGGSFINISVNEPHTFLNNYVQ